jgi:starch synthase (maltosyl-transferring)
VAHDILSDETYEWGSSVYVKLEPALRAAHVVHLVAP